MRVISQKSLMLRLWEPKFSNRAREMDKHIQFILIKQQPSGKGTAPSSLVAVRSLSVHRNARDGCEHAENKITKKDVDITVNYGSSREKRHHSRQSSPQQHQRTWAGRITLAYTRKCPGSDRQATKRHISGQQHR